MYLTLNGNGGTDVPSSEDCLAINIWAPSKDRKQDTAVLIWIHGGGFVFGTVSVILCGKTICITYIPVERHTRL